MGNLLYFMTLLLNTTHVKIENPPKCADLTRSMAGTIERKSINKFLHIQIYWLLFLFLISLYFKSLGLGYPQ